MTLNDTIRDRFVCGIKNESVQKKLLAESALTLDGAIKIAHAMETAGRDATELREQRNTSATVHKVEVRNRNLNHRCKNIHLHHSNIRTVIDHVGGVDVITV